ncbi:DUF1064 domain-containing protein [Aliarcobacter butzleri]|uniref:DUF1064 domain-containing protein n=1 Tax=Aliarcobacter butzleri TaxID=28197 RepID=UPI00126A55D2|nr:DUF1064 domain-containing protein [Aliarcobacter butzleri]
MRIKDVKELNNLRIGKNAYSKIQSVLVTSEKKKSKYSNQKTSRIYKNKTVIFDSIKEADYFDKLHLELRAGIIKNLDLQPQFEIIPKFTYGDTKYSKIKYIADFSYIKNGDFFVVDVKGFKTDVYKIKIRLFLIQNPNVKFIEI